MRIFLRTLAFLDAVALVLLGMQLWYIANNFNAIMKLSEKVSSVLMFPMFILLIFGAIGLWFGKKFGFILYYIQFPFRLYLWVFTIGFIALLPEAFGSFENYWFNMILKICIAAEFIRLYLTIKTHLKINRLQLH